MTPIKSNLGRNIPKKRARAFVNFSRRLPGDRIEQQRAGYTDTLHLQVFVRLPPYDIVRKNFSTSPTGKSALLVAAQVLLFANTNNPTRLSGSIWSKLLEKVMQKQMPKSSSDSHAVPKVIRGDGNSIAMNCMRDDERSDFFRYKCAGPYR